VSRIRRWDVVAINVFLIFHLVAIACWCVPSNVLPVVACRELFGPYLRWVGLFQAWDMFAPVPKHRNSYLEAMVVYSDGSTDYWNFPRMEHMSLGERYAKERYRKFEEVLVDDRYSDLWPDAARFVARQVTTGKKRPEMVMLVVNWSDLREDRDGNLTDSPWQSHVFYRYRVEPEDFN
jgi:hypothetical protein